MPKGYRCFCFIRKRMSNDYALFCGRALTRCTRNFSSTMESLLSILPSALQSPFALAVSFMETTPATALFRKTASARSISPSRLASPYSTLADSVDSVVVAVCVVCTVVLVEELVVFSAVADSATVVDTTVSVVAGTDSAAVVAAVVTTVVAGFAEVVSACVAVVTVALAVVVVALVVVVVVVALVVVAVVVVVVVAVVVVVQVCTSHFWQALPFAVHCWTLAPLLRSALATSTAAAS